MAITPSPHPRASPSTVPPDWNRIWANTLEKPNALETLLRSRQPIGYGQNGVVYRVSGVAWKIGRVDPIEAERQAWVYQHFKRALPVLAYAARLKLPEEVTRRSCPIHGNLADEEEVHSCRCGNRMDVLVMPVARYAGAAFFEREVQAAIQQVQHALSEKFNFFWDEKPSHLLRYRDRVVLADFGEEAAAEE